jgi:uncharacterized protein YecE (DUF72 family)
VIALEKVLWDCSGELGEFGRRWICRGRSWGRCCFSPYFGCGVFPDRLAPFLKSLPGASICEEIRTRDWLDAELANLLRKYRVALVLQNWSWMADPDGLKFDPSAAGWTYIPWLGDRRAIEAQTTTFDKEIVERKQELSCWADYCYRLSRRGVAVYAYANNHHSGFAPGTMG